MKRSKLISLLLLLAMIMVFSVACGSEQGESSDTSDSGKQTQDTDIVENDVEIASTGSFSIEYPAGWIAVDSEDQIFVRKDGDIPFMLVEEIGAVGSPGTFVTNEMNNFTDKYQERVAYQPEAQTKEIGERKLAGFVAKYSSEDGSSTITRYEYVEDIDGMLYLYTCEFVSQGYGDVKEDETTYFEFEHLMESMKVE